MTDLVEYIQTLASLPMMTDVKGKFTIDILQKWYSKLKAEDYTVDQWNDAIRYILDSNHMLVRFSNIDEINDWIRTGELPEKDIIMKECNSIEEKYEHEIDVFQKCSMDECMKTVCLELLQNIYDELPAINSTYDIHMIMPLLEKRYYAFDSKNNIHKNVETVVVRDLFAELSEKNVSCKEVGLLVQKVLSIIKD